MDPNGFDLGGKLLSGQFRDAALAFGEAPRIPRTTYRSIL